MIEKIDRRRKTKVSKDYYKRTTLVFELYHGQPLPSRLPSLIELKKMKKNKCKKKR